MRSNTLMCAGIGMKETRWDAKEYSFDTQAQRSLKQCQFLLSFPLPRSHLIETAGSEQLRGVQFWATNLTSFIICKDKRSLFFVCFFIK